MGSWDELQAQDFVMVVKLKKKRLNADNGHNMHRNSVLTMPNNFHWKWNPTSIRSFLLLCKPRSVLYLYFFATLLRGDIFFVPFAYVQFWDFVLNVSYIFDCNTLQLCNSIVYFLILHAISLAIDSVIHRYITH